MEFELKMKKYLDFHKVNVEPEIEKESTDMPRCLHCPFDLKFMSLFLFLQSLT